MLSLKNGVWKINKNINFLEKLLKRKARLEATVVRKTKKRRAQKKFAKQQAKKNPQ